MKSPSKAWLDSVFSSGPRRDLKSKNKVSTRTRHETQQPGSATQMYAQGDIHLVALQLLEHMRRCGQVKRFKAEAFDLVELGGPPKHVVDILVEDENGTAHVIQVKSKNYLTADVEDVLAEERLLLREKGFNYLVWTSGNVLAPPASHSIRMFADKHRDPPSKAIMEQIGDDVRNGFTCLNQLLDKYGWNDSISSAAHLYFHLNITKKIDEESQIQSVIPQNFYAYLLDDGTHFDDWWSSLKSSEFQE